VIFTSISFFILWFCRLRTTLVCSSSLCGLICLSCFSQIFDRFRLLDQLWSSADPINDFDVIHVADLEIWLFRRFKYSHMCRHLYFAVLCYQHGYCEFVHRFILFVFSEFALYQCTLPISMNDYHLFLSIFFFFFTNAWFVVELIIWLLIAGLDINNVSCLGEIKIELKTMGGQGRKKYI
jgi:hypothetical protein